MNADKMRPKSLNKFRCPDYEGDNHTIGHADVAQFEREGVSQRFEWLQLALLPVPAKSSGPSLPQIEDLWASQVMPVQMPDSAYNTHLRDFRDDRIEKLREDEEIRIQLTGDAAFTHPMQEAQRLFEAYALQRAQDENERLHQLDTLTSAYKELMLELDAVKAVANKFNDRRTKLAATWKALKKECKEAVSEQESDLLFEITGDQRKTIGDMVVKLSTDFKNQCYIPAIDDMAKVQNWIEQVEKKATTVQLDRIESFQLGIQSRASKAVERIEKFADRMKAVTDDYIDTIRTAADEARRKIREQTASELNKAAKKEEKENESVPASSANTVTPAVQKPTSAATPAASISPVSMDRTRNEDFQKNSAIREAHLRTAAPITTSTDAAVKKDRFVIKKTLNGAINKVANTQKNIEACVTSLTNEMLRVAAMNVKEWSVYAVLLLAELLVGKAFSECHVNLKTAFPLGAVCVGVCAQYGDLLPVLLAECYARCPYTIPHFSVRTSTMSAADYNTVICRKENETGEQHMERMGGCVRLYAAICQTDDTRGVVNPHGIHNAWAFIARVLNSHPKSPTTADILYKFIETSAYKLSLVYQSQFNKLMAVIEHDVLPSMIVGPASSRLETFLVDVKKGSTYQFPHPDGRTPD
ncbi:hypothetical protein, variant [Sphaeroforma arctica JP610]|uniref:mRNA export factor GLE1 n=1 Tax=Sphaeroforma arctica JP610 TaxID=667725 RepID=A0A0L0G9S3_9EUKA|nr:hypothetical protein, variant [Sphaeroforma arctica JP610]KNC85777.1 hypothetical protein, variant [Sphaeroforma arctica JP610]|eukprot:XP_014159680.1 hypothetical protein, variant [Sphaeroforma arctica JP610]